MTVLGLVVLSLAVLSLVALVPAVLSLAGRPCLPALVGLLRRQDGVVVLSEVQAAPAGRVQQAQAGDLPLQAVDVVLDLPVRHLVL